METITTIINHIVERGLELQDKYYKKDHIELDFLNVYTRNWKELEEYVSEISLIGKVVKQYERGVIVTLNEPIDVRGKHLEIVQISSPRENRVHIGYLSYHLINFEQLRKDFDMGNQFTLVQKPQYQRYELSEDGSDVKVYFTSKSFTREFLEETKDIADEHVKEIENLKKEIESEKAKTLSLIADFQNYQKRVESEKAVWGAMSNMSLIQDILEIHDDLALAMNDEALSLENAKSSIKSAQDKLIDTSKRAGVEPIIVSVGDEFDKTKMEAISAVDAGEEKKNKVIAVISSAYKYSNKDGVLKAAKVVVGK